MLLELKEKYKGFGDATIYGISYNQIRDKKGFQRNVTVNLNAFNWQNEKWETLKIIFIDVKKFRFFEGEKSTGQSVNSTIIFEAYINEINDLIIFDFFALQISQDVIAEDPNSDFVIHCMKIEYEIMDTSITDYETTH